MAIDKRQPDHSYQKIKCFIRMIYRHDKKDELFLGFCFESRNVCLIRLSLDSSSMIPLKKKIFDQYSFLSAVSIWPVSTFAVLNNIVQAQDSPGILLQYLYKY